MGKKKQPANYDRTALANLSLQLKHVRKPLQGGNIPEITIDLERLEKTIQGLQKKEREGLERFWGLIPSTVNHGRKISKRTGRDIAFQNMMNAALEVMKKLIHFEYLYQFDSKVKEIVDGLSAKFDKNGVEEVSDMDAIRYLLILLIFIANGPRLVFEEKGYEINLQEEAKSHFDEYALLNATWSETAKFLPDHSIKLKLLMDTISMFDLRDVVAMKRFVRLPIGKDEDIETEPMQSFAEIRLFKEKLFPYGAWDVMTVLIYGSPKEEGCIDVSDFAEHFSELREDWGAFEKYKESEVIVVTTEGEKRLKSYNIGGLNFTDIYEVMSLYVCRNLL